MKSRLQTWPKRCRLHVHHPFTHSLFGCWWKACSKMIFFFLIQVVDFLKLNFADLAGHLPENCMVHVELLFYVNTFLV